MATGSPWNWDSLGASLFYKQRQRRLRVKQSCKDSLARQIAKWPLIHVECLDEGLRRQLERSRDQLNCPEKQRQVELPARGWEQPITGKGYLSTRWAFFRLCSVLQVSGFSALSRILGWTLVMQKSNGHSCSCKLSLIHIPRSNPNNTYSLTIRALVMPVVLNDIGSLSSNE